MRRFMMMIALLFGFAALPFAGHAQDGGDMDDGDTMDPVTEGLPADAADEAREASEFGLETAREARNLGDGDATDAGRQFGQDTADRARNLGNDE